MDEKKLLAAYSEGFYAASNRALVLLVVGFTLVLVLIVVNPLNLTYVYSRTPYCEPAAPFIPEVGSDVFVCTGTSSAGVSVWFPTAVVAYGIIAGTITGLLGCYLLSGTLQIRRVIARRANQKVLGLLDEEKKEGQ